MYCECFMNYVSESRWQITTKYFVTPKVVVNGIMLALKVHKNYIFGQYYAGF